MTSQKKNLTFDGRPVLPLVEPEVLRRDQLVTRLVDFLGEVASRSAKEQCVALLASLGRHCGDKVLAMLGKLSGLMPAL